MRAIKNTDIFTKEEVEHVLNFFIINSSVALNDTRLGRLSLIRNVLVAYSSLSTENMTNMNVDNFSIINQAFSIINLLLEQNNQVHVSSDEMLLLEENINFRIAED